MRSWPWTDKGGGVRVQEAEEEGGRGEGVIQYTCTHTHRHTCTHALKHTSTCIHTQTHTCMSSHMHAHMHARKHTQLTCTHVHTYTRMASHTHVCVLTSEGHARPPVVREKSGGLKQWSDRT